MRLNLPPSPPTHTAVAVFLTMLHLGIQNIHLGPQLPAFVSTNVLKVLQDNYNLKPVSLDDHDRVRSDMKY
jgi:hydroxylamine reductase